MARVSSCSGVGCGQLSTAAKIGKSMTYEGVASGFPEAISAEMA